MMDDTVNLTPTLLLYWLADHFQFTAQMKRTLHQMSNRLFTQGRYSFVVVSIITVALFGVGFLLDIMAPEFAHFKIDRKEATEIQTNTLSNFISLLGIGLAVLAVLMNIIQLSYKRLTILNLLISNTSFAPLVYFGVLNVVLGAINYQLHSDGIFYPDNLFIPMAVTGHYLFMLFAVFQAYVFFKTFSYANYNTVLEAYIGTVRKMVFTNKPQSSSDQEKEALQTASSELRSEIETSIEEKRLAVIKRIFDFYKEVQAKYPYSDTLFALSADLQKWILDCKKSRNIHVYNTLLEHWRDMFRAALISGSQEQLTVLKLFARDLYQFEEGEAGEIGRRIVRSDFPIRLKEIAMYQTLLQADADDLTALKTAYERIEPILFEFSELIKSMIKARDTDGLEECLQELKMLNADHEISYDVSEMEMQITLAKRGIEGFAMPDEGQLTRYRLYKKLEVDKYAVAFGNLGWIVYRLIDGKELPGFYKNEIDVLLRYLPKNTSDILQMSADLFEHNERIFGWENWIWSNEKRLPGEVYTMGTHQTFLALGLIVLLIKNGTGKPEADAFDKDELRKLTSIGYWIKQVQDASQRIPDTWAAILNISTEDVSIQQNKVTEIFNLYQKTQEEVKNHELAQAQFSPQKVEEFRNMIHGQWQKTNTLTRVFDYCDAITVNPDRKLMEPGLQRINFQKAKFMFTDIHHSKMYGIEWGHQVNDRVTQLFMQRIGESSIKAKPVGSYIDLLESIPEDWIGDDNSRIILFHSFTSSYMVLQGVQGLENFRFIGRNEQSEFPFDVTGIYREKVILVPIRSNSLKDRILLTKLPGSIQLLRREEEQWMDKQLNVDIIPIDDENAERLAKQKYPEEKISDKLIDEMKAGVFIEINETLDFEIIDSSKIIIYAVNNTEPDLD
jgi:hypothetical protein